MDCLWRLTADGMALLVLLDVRYINDAEAATAAAVATIPTCSWSSSPMVDAAIMMMLGLCFVGYVVLEAGSTLK